MLLERRIPLSYWFEKMKLDLLIVTVFSIIIFFVSTYFVSFNIPISIGAFLGTAIALVLSFKLSHSYDRWWEGRKIWGAIVNDSRSLVIQLKGFVNEENKAIVSKMAHRQIAWCYSLSQNLRNQDPAKNIDKFISETELKSVINHNYLPLGLIGHHMDDLHKLHKEKTINDYQQVQLDDTLVNLCASMGKAERIKNTDFPKTYRITLHLFIYIFLITLALALSDIHSLLEIPFLVIISIPFFLLEKIAFNIQDPFENKPTDVPMTAISRTIEINIRQQLGEEEVPEPISSDTFYIL